MEQNNLFSRYTGEKMERFNKWLNTNHGQQVYRLFRQFAHKWREAGNSKCSASLIVHRLRWEAGIQGRYMGYKISNDHAPMLARQLVQDDASYADFFSFHEPSKAA
jgi:hypothetical protein